MSAASTTVRAQLFSLADAKYADFQRSLIPTLPPERIIGVRTPALRRYARAINGTDEARDFLADLPHDYYDENNLHAALLEFIPDFETALFELERFLPHLDNWATCDMFCPKALLREPTRFFDHLERWLASDEVYTARFALVRLTNSYLKPPLFSPEVLSLAAAVEGEDYYLRMAVAWFFSMALVKQYAHALPYLTDNRLDAWVHNKAIQKAVESRQLAPDIKVYLKTLRRPIKRSIS